MASLLLPLVLFLLLLFELGVLLEEVDVVEYDVGLGDLLQVNQPADPDPRHEPILPTVVRDELKTKKQLHGNIEIFHIKKVLGGYIKLTSGYCSMTH